MLLFPAAASKKEKNKEKTLKKSPQSFVRPAAAGPRSAVFHPSGQFSAAFICCTVVLMRLLTVATDSTLSFEDGRLLTSIWNATVISDPRDAPIGFELVEAPPPPPGRPSGRIVNPDGSSATFDGSSPLITTLTAGMSIGA
ncbi:hypothetical protein ACMD2_04154 [Ananas comosus]|uniref:Uncharacterized protein n=1 Tax=Ananas comosus TaxID=4615 RepID=A0A199W6Z5_ANACO|nr:hypothetical protein ACMD2_04154 [Ananas comosus]